MFPADFLRSPTRINGEILSIVSTSNVGLVHLAGHVLNSANDEIYDSLTTATRFFLDDGGCPIA